MIDLSHTLTRYAPASKYRLGAAALVTARRVPVPRRTKSNTGIAGISESVQICGGKPYARFSVQLGGRRRSVSSKTIGRSEALRRAIRIRAQFEAAVRALNAAILQARAAAAAAHKQEIR